MTNELPPPRPSSPPLAHPDTFLVYRWVNPATTCEHPYLATNAERSFLLSLGEHGLEFDLEFPDEAERWLREDYTPTAERFTLNLTAVRDLVEQTFVGGAVFGFVSFDDQLAIRRIELSLQEQKTADAGPEYVIDELGRYQRWYRSPDLYTPVTEAERALLDVCVATFGARADNFRHLVTALPTPRYQQTTLPGASP